jgi:hypothetical protein
MRHIAGLAALVLVVAACGEPAGSGDTGMSTTSMSTTSTRVTTTTVPSTTSTGAAPTSTVVIGGSDWVIAPDETGGVPLDLMVGCSSPTFPVSALESIVPLVGTGHEHIEAAVAPFLESAEGDHWPQAEEWQILHATQDQVILVHIDAPTIGFQTVELVDETWRWSGSSLGENCALEARLPEGLNRVRWELDPAVEHGPASTTLQFVASEWECASGQPMGDRFRAPHVVITDTEVRITMAADPPPGDAQSCPSNPEESVVIDLGMPLGDRTVVDGLSVLGDLVDLLG